jgi:hypothetical protein
MRRDLPENFAFQQRVAHQFEVVIFEVAQPAMDQLGRPRRGAAGQIVHLAKEHGIAAADGVAGDAAAVHTTTNDCEVVDLTHPVSPPAPIVWRLPSDAPSSLSAIWLSLSIKPQPKTKATGVFGV